MKKQPEIDYGIQKQGLEWNKDLAFLMEVQRMENSANNAAVAFDDAARYVCLARWGSMIKPLFIKDDLLRYEEILKSVRVIMQDNDRIRYQYNPFILDKMHDFLNEMNVKHKLNLREARGALEATEF